MKLSEYLAASRGRGAILARTARLSSAYLSQMVSGVRPVRKELAGLIERATEGAVPCEELRPDLAWHRVPDPDWPHPQGRPCIDVAAPQPEQRAA